MLDELPKIYQVVELSSGKAILRTRKVPIHIQENPRIIVVRPHMVGICRSDVKELLNVRTVRHDFGHEIVGTVAWADKGATTARANNRFFLIRDMLSPVDEMARHLTRFRPALQGVPL